MLDFSDHTRTDISILTSAAVCSLPMFVRSSEMPIDNLPLKLSGIIKRSVGLVSRRRDFHEDLFFSLLCL